MDVVTMRDLEAAAVTFLFPSAYFNRNDSYTISCMKPSPFGAFGHIEQHRED